MSSISEKLKRINLSFLNIRIYSVCLVSVDDSEIVRKNIFNNLSELSFDYGSILRDIEKNHFQQSDMIFFFTECERAFSFVENAVNLHPSIAISTLEILNKVQTKC
jgi:hypothetical protein